MRPIPSFACSSPKLTLQGHRRGRRKPSRFDSPVSVPVFKGDTDSPRQRRIHSRPAGGGRRKDLYAGGGAEPIGDDMSLYYVSHLRHSPRMRDIRRPYTVDKCGARHVLWNIQEERAVESDHRYPGATGLPPVLNHITCHCRPSEQVGHGAIDEGMENTVNERTADGA